MPDADPCPALRHARTCCSGMNSLTPSLPQVSQKGSASPRATLKTVARGTLRLPRFFSWGRQRQGLQAEYQYTYLCLSCLRREQVLGKASVLPAGTLE